MELAADIVSWAFLLTGSALGIIGGFGLLRLPDFYSRLHAASITDTLCAGLILAGLIIQEGLTLDSVKLFFVFLFLLYTSPIAAHAVARAAMHGKLKPLVADDIGEEGPSSKP